jgi:putative ABC transport system permease protein
MAEIALISGSNDMSSFVIPGYEPKEGESMAIKENWVGPGFFNAMGIPLQAGRGFIQQDGPAAQKVAVINEQMAHKYFDGQDPVGKRIRSGRKPEDREIEIVGVVRDGKHADLREKSESFLYLPYEHHDSVARMTFYARTAQDAASMGALFRSEVRDADPNLPVFDMKTVDRQIGESVFADRLVAMLASFFGVLATLLSAIGLYGVKSDCGWPWGRRGAKSFGSS